MPTSHYKLDMNVDVEPLKRALKEHSDLFGQYDYRGSMPGSPHYQMTDIWVRYNDITPFLEKGDLSGFADEHDSIWYDAASKLPEAKDIIFKVMSHVRGERLGGVLITKLPPGGEITPHTDSGWHAEYYDKYYVVVKNKPGAVFGFIDGDIVPEEGDVWWFDNSIEHWVKNESNEERIAMIICIKREK